MYNIIIIGAGPAGITAGIYLKRAGYNVMIISNNVSSLKRTYKIENYYGFENGVSGEELYNKGIKQAENLEIPIVNSEVIGIRYVDNCFEIVTANQGIDEQYIAEFVILATGVNRNSPAIKGIKEFEGRGISYCAVCDAPFFKEKNVAVLGSGEYAIGEIEELKPIAKNVTMLTNGEKPVEKRTDIEIDQDKINEFRGTSKIEEIVFESGETKKIDGVFIAQGIASSVDFAKKLGARVENNAIVVNNNMETTVPNVYACGDCTGGVLQISKATYEGMVAGLDIIKKLRSDK